MTPHEKLKGVFRLDFQIFSCNAKLCKIYASFWFVGCTRLQNATTGPRIQNKDSFHSLNLYWQCRDSTVHSDGYRKVILDSICGVVRWFSCTYFHLLVVSPKMAVSPRHIEKIVWGTYVFCRPGGLNWLYYSFTLSTVLSIVCTFTAITTTIGSVSLLASSGRAI